MRVVERRGTSTVEVGGDLLDLHLGGGDLLPADSDQCCGAGDALGEVVDVDVGALELVQDRIEFRERCCVPRP